MSSNDTNSAQQSVREWRRGIRELVHRYPEAKVKAKEATNSDAWGPTSEQKMELVKIACNHYDDRELVYRALFKRMGDDSSYWMHSTKAMDVLEFFLYLEVPDILPKLHQQRQRLVELQSYDSAEHEDPVRQRQLNGNVRSKAQRLLRLMDDEAFLAEEGQRVLTMMTRLGGGPSGSSAAAAGSATIRGSPQQTSPSTSTAPRNSGGGVPSSSAARGIYDDEEDDEVKAGAGRHGDKGVFLTGASNAHHRVGDVASQPMPVPVHAQPIQLFQQVSQPPHGTESPARQSVGHAPAPHPGATASAHSPLFHGVPTTAAPASLFAQPAASPALSISTPQHPYASTSPVASLPTTVPLGNHAPAVIDPFGEVGKPTPVAGAARAPASAIAAFDPFAEVNKAMEEERQRKAAATMPTGSGQSSIADFFGPSSSSTTAPRGAAVPPVSSHAPAAAGSAAGSSRSSPVPVHHNTGGDRMSDAMMAQLEGYQGKKTVAGRAGETQSLGSLMQSQQRQY